MMFLEHSEAVGPQYAVEDDANARSIPPSLFELIMQERLASGMKPAAEYLVQTLCDTHPTWSQAPVIRYFDEAYAVLKYFIERYFLTRYDALLSEKVYGMKRVEYVAASPTSEATTRRMSIITRRRTLIFAVLIPYIKGKLDSWFKDLSEQGVGSFGSTRNDGSRSSEDQATSQQEARIISKWYVFWRRLRQIDLLRRLKKAFLGGYPFVHMAYEAVQLLFQLFYLTGDSQYFSPFLRLIRVILVRSTPEDETRFQSNQTAHREKVLAIMNRQGPHFRLARGVVRVGWTILDHSYVLLLLGIGGYKLLEWMYSDEGASIKAHLSNADIPVPPPPVPPQSSGRVLMASSNAEEGTCPVCGQVRVNPAVSVSGFVCCFKCLHDYIQSNQRCPVSGMSCSTSSILRIFDDNAQGAT